MVHTDVQPVPPANRGLMRLWLGKKTSRTLFRALILGLITFLIVRFAFLPVRIRGASMEPTFADGSIHIVSRLQYRWKEPARGDLVVIPFASGRIYYFKRILGLPGEKIAFDQGRLIIDGKRQEEPYLKDRGRWTLPEIKLGDDEYFVAGDNRDIPWEAHTLGTIRRYQIAGGLLW